MKRLVIVLVTLLFTLSDLPLASAWSVGSGAGAGCHEEISAEAFRRFLNDISGGARLTIEMDKHLKKRWKRLIHIVADAVGQPDLDDKRAFALTSLIIGVRAPDTDGHAIGNLESLRAVHADPDPKGQYAHSLRATDDDYQAGDVTAIEGTKDSIKNSVLRVVETLRLPLEQRFGEAPIYLDFYGIVNVPVYLPAYDFGYAAHTVQDAFTHMIRDEKKQWRPVLHVLNYVEAIHKTYVERRDGLAHSAFLDHCHGEVHAARVEAATQATLDLVETLREMIHSQDNSALDKFFERWFTHRPGCHVDNQMCGNPRALDLARKEPTGPYLFRRKQRKDDVYDGKLEK